jgi:predicted ester cyclase
VAAPGPLIERALRLWSEPLADADELEAFRGVYTDPVLVNGRRTDLAELVARARMLKSALEPIHHRIESTVVTPDRVAIAFTISGRHVGTLATPLGELSATHRDVAVTGLDIFELEQGPGRVTAVWAVADWPALLAPSATTG